MAQDPAAAATTEEQKVEKKVDESKSNENIVRDLDLVIYGATGFTGQYVAKYLTKRIATTDLNIKWAIAGRNQTKLTQLHTEIKQVYENNIPKENTTTTKTKDDLNNLPILIGDVTKLDELKRIALRTSLIISCVGPYRFWGENVVKICAENGTHYIDICGEPEFMDRCASKYFKTANDNNAIIIHACGFDSIPSDMGTEFINQQFLKSNGLCSNVEVYMTFDVPQGYPAHVTTFEAAVHGFSSVDELRKFRKELDKAEWRHSRKKIARVGPKQRVKKETYFWSEDVSKWSMIFPFADSSVVNNSQGIRSALLAQQAAETKETKENENVSSSGPSGSGSSSISASENSKRSFIFPQFAAYLSFNSKSATYQAVAIGGIGTLLTKFNWGRNILLKYPEQVTFGAFSHAGPTEAQMDATTFSAKFFGQGYSQQTLEKVRNEVKAEIAKKAQQAQGKNDSENKDDNATDTSEKKEEKTDTEKEAKEDKEEKDEDTLVRERLFSMKPDLKLEGCVNGPDPGYKATATMSVESALCLLNDIELIRQGSLELNAPGIKGGVFTPAAVFSASTLMDRLTTAGVEFKVITQTTKKEPKDVVKENEKEQKENDATDNKE